MADCHKKMTFREFGVRDAGEDFRCRECGWTVEVRDWMKRLLFIVWCIITSILFTLIDEQCYAFGLNKNWTLIIGVPIVAASGYVYYRVVGYWLYCIAWKLDERYR